MHVRCLLVVSVAALATALPAAEDEVVCRWTFDSADDFRGWEVGRGVEGLRVEGGRLAGRLAHADAYIFAPAVSIPLDGLVLRVRWSCPRGGSGQCYFATEKSPDFAEARVVSREVPSEGMTIETEFPLDRGGKDGATLTRFRLDPFNGATEVEFAIDEVILVRMEARLEVGFAPVGSVVAAGESAPFRVWLRHLGGRRDFGKLRVAFGDKTDDIDKLELGPGATSASRKLRPIVAPAGPGFRKFVASLWRDGQEVHRLESGILAGLSDEPTGVAIESGSVRVEIVRPVPGERGSAAARVWLKEGDRWREAALLFPLMEIVTLDRNRIVHRSWPELSVTVHEERRILLSLPTTIRSVIRPEVELRFEPDRAGGPSKREAIAIRVSLRGLPSTQVLRIAGPTVRRRVARGMDPLERHALFGGLEFLEPGWRSSSDRAVGPRFADRWTPHPFKVCLPVMAVEQDGIATALLWDPLQEWAPGRRMPAATFASPNFLEEQSDHAFSLSIPDVGEARGENEAQARAPFPLGEAGISISMALHVGRGEPALAAARRWYEHFGIPAAPPAPHDEKKSYDLLARCLGETIYWPAKPGSAEKGWRGHWFLEKPSHYRADFAAELLLHARTTGEKRWIEATGLDGRRPLIDTIGSLWSRAMGGGGSAEAAVRAMREDGTYPYRDTPEVKESTRRHTSGEFDSLGEDGSTSLGTCVQGALPLVRRLALTGDPALRGPAERALKALHRFRVPRGAQVWEVHQQIPDIRAAALAVEMLVDGYLTTGDASYLRDAHYWAEAGLPFLFTWRTPHDPHPAIVRTSRDRDDASKGRGHAAADLFEEPRRQVTPYGTIPVLGPTFYVVNWFGVLVQWCGLEWAAKVLDLLELRDDPVLRAAAEGVARSGLQQMFDREPWTGLYPDVWDLRGNWAGGALISPRLIIDALRAGGHLPQELRTWSRRAGDGPDALLVHGWGKVRECRRTEQVLGVKLEFLAGEPCEVLVARAVRPKSVSVGAKMLSERSDDSEGWRHDRERGLLGIRFVSKERLAAIEVRFE